MFVIMLVAVRIAERLCADCTTVRRAVAAERITGGQQNCTCEDCSQDKTPHLDIPPR
jgi:hypothetical protein